jgi:hypothetical protein
MTRSVTEVSPDTVTPVVFDANVADVVLIAKSLFSTTKLHKAPSPKTVPASAYNSATRFAISKLVA